MILATKLWLSSPHLPVQKVTRVFFQGLTFRVVGANITTGRYYRLVIPNDVTFPPSQPRTILPLFHMYVAEMQVFFVASAFREHAPPLDRLESCFSSAIREHTRAPACREVAGGSHPTVTDERIR